MAFGRLTRTPTQQPISDINVTPLVDVMLVLVVIFILTAPLLATSIPLDLPRAGIAQSVSAPQFVTLVIDKTGQSFLNDQPLSLPDLAEQLVRLATDAPNIEIQLRADTTVPYGRVVEVMGVAQQAGLHRIGFVATPAP